MPYIARPSSGGTPTRRKGRRKTRPLSTITKSIGYSATVNDTLLEITKAISATESTSADISHVTVTNTGSVPALAVFAYNRWTDEDTVGAVSYLHFLLSAGENVSLPAQRAIMTDDSDMYEGDVVTATAPNSNEYTDSGDNVASGELNNTTDPVVFELDNGHEQYRVGDLIRCENEILRVEGTYDDNPTASTVADNHIVVSRGWNGSTNAAHSGTPDIRFPFFNAHHDYDKYSVAQSDDQGRWSATNFYGYGRASTYLSGIQAGSVAIQFYSQGYQKLGLSDITNNTESGLTASTAYEFDITVDGGTTFSNLSFTVDSSNTKFGGSNGIVAKIQDALDTQYYTSGNLFQKRVTCTIEGGDIVFRSGSKLSTSAISLGVGSSLAAEFFGTGRIPAASDIMAAVDARLETETTYDPITYSTTYKDIFIRDDGLGNLIYQGRVVGSINYETGGHSWAIPSCPNAEFVVSALYNSPLSGKQDARESAKINSLIAVYGNTPQQKGNATLKVDTY
tara:strand:+ start:2107 stop:3633 length:1527 start_codon:yes stop_codon:yes gene_type:complete